MLRSGVGRLTVRAASYRQGQEVAPLAAEGNQSYEHEVTALRTSAASVPQSSMLGTQLQPNLGCERLTTGV